MPFNNSISKYDWQYIVTGFLILVFIFTDLIELLKKIIFTLYQDLLVINPTGFYINPNPCRFKSFIK